MRKIAKAILSTLSCSALFLTVAGVLHAQNSTATAYADESKNTTATALLSPLSYEEFLSLSSPTDAALTGNYTAVSDGNKIFLFDRAKNQYFTFTHDKKVTKLQFSADETLYFLDEDMFLHSLNPKRMATDPTATSLAFACTTFYIHENDLYYTVEAGGKAKINKTTLSALSSGSTLLVEEVTPGPTLFFYGDKLYYTSGRELWLYDGQYNQPKYLATFPHISKVSSTCIAKGILFVCAEAGLNGEDAQNLFAYDLNALSEESNSDKVTPIPTDEEGGYKALTVHGDYMYAVKKDAVRQYDLMNAAFTTYEICSRSDSVHRLDDASETHLAGDTLLIADNGNERITVYDTKTATYKTPIPSTVQATYLASDGETVLSANGEIAVLYDLTEEGYGQTLATFEDFGSSIVGVASVYGKYYFATADERFVAQPSETGWTLSEAHRANITATLLTADAYGHLYIAGGGCVYKYTESQFFTDTEREKVVDNFPHGADKMLVDYAGGVYALLNGKLQKMGGSTYDLNTPLVYHPTANIQSFSFGIEDNIAYILYEENHLATTSLLHLPTVKNIAVAGTDKDIFAQESAKFEVVEVQPNALVIRFDINALSGAELFPYTAYERRKQPFVALKMGTTSPYDILAVYDESQEEYFTCITLSSFCQSADAYRTEYAENKVGYLTNAVTLYKFPYLTDLLTVQRLSSGQRVTLLGEIEKLDYAYYHISITDENGVVQTGYIPKAYITSFNGAPTEAEVQRTENQTNGLDTLWRFLYLSLGFGVVLILIDILILRKRKPEKEQEIEPEPQPPEDVPLP